MKLTPERIAELRADAESALKVNCLFGMTGVELLALIDALSEAQAQPRIPANLAAALDRFATLYDEYAEVRNRIDSENKDRLYLDTLFVADDVRDAYRAMKGVQE